jgi:hypothetical protein
MQYSRAGKEHLGHYEGGCQVERTLNANLDPDLKYPNPDEKRPKDPDPEQEPNMITNLDR